MEEVPVPLNELTDRQLHLHLVSLYTKHARVLERLESFMANLTESVAALQGAVDNVAIRLATRVATLSDAVAAAVAAGAADEAALQEALTEAQAAADAINAEIAELNSLGAEPDVPVAPVTDDEDLPPAPSDEEGTA